MKPRLLTALALGLAILLATPSTSFADATSTSKPKPKPTPTSKPTPTPTPDFESAVDQYKIAIDEFRAEMKAREQSLNKIRQKFIADVNEAKRIAETATRNAKTVKEKSATLAQRDRSIVLAVSARTAAITAMGPAPLEPEEPLELLKSVKPDEMEPTKKTKRDKPKPNRKK